QQRIAKQLYHVSEQTIRNDATMALLLYPSMRNAYREDAFSADTAHYAFLREVNLDRSNTDKGIAYYCFLDYYLKEKYRLADVQDDVCDGVKVERSGRGLDGYNGFAHVAHFARRLCAPCGADCP